MESQYNELHGKTVVVTGATGYIGSQLTKKLLELDCKVIRLSRKKPESITGTKDLISDIRNLDTWNKLVQEADIIFHLAGDTSINNAKDNPEENFLTTVMPIRMLINETKKIGIKKVIFASTVTVYGLTNQLPVSESRLPNPITIYDENKLLAERELLSACTRGDIECVILRLANVYGESSNKSRSKDRGVLNKITQLAIDKQDIFIYGEGKFIRDYVNIQDVTEAFVLSACVPGIGGNIFNVGTGTGRTIHEAFSTVVNLVHQIHGYKSEIKFAPFAVDVNPIELRNFIADVGLINEIIGWTPKIPFEVGIRRLIEDLS